MQSAPRVSKRRDTASAEERLAALAALRGKQSKSILGEIRSWLMTQRALPRSALGKAIYGSPLCGPSGIPALSPSLAALSPRKPEKNQVIDPLPPIPPE
jgi:hypothetical protein